MRPSSNLVRSGPRLRASTTGWSSTCRTSTCHFRTSRMSPSAASIAFRHALSSPTRPSISRRCTAWSSQAATSSNSSGSRRTSARSRTTARRGATAILFLRTPRTTSSLERWACCSVAHSRQACSSGRRPSRRPVSSWCCPTTRARCPPSRCSTTPTRSTSRLRTQSSGLATKGFCRSAWAISSSACARTTMRQRSPTKRTSPRSPGSSSHASR
mmetsp:Transcript_3182/g.7627  ORF Transcript_3182/g.7627 Transcript_3182/m.7627 type:complete len:214 (-) Transcript_3182:104-745(-)